MRQLPIKIKLFITIAVGLIVGIAYLTLISHPTTYEAYCNALRFLPAVVIDFVLPLLPPLLAGLLLGSNKKERKSLITSGISIVVVLVLLALLYTIRFGGLAS